MKKTTKSTQERIIYLKGQIDLVQKLTKELLECHEKDKKMWEFENKKEFFTNLLPILDILHLAEKNEKKHPEETRKILSTMLPQEIAKFKKLYEK